ncbi:MAG: tRNA (adenosine(37)-N6)-threonylcarbamoyltransferase complex dimerization subunit type 1 TsaB, partial [Clostridia bacterium]|nr:tRNA (adenosine(37)-N6)-threonylcarbamoyltransferase complex dimerization subunit type 1 TsaB [Clostridia bacterium]
MNYLLINTANDELVILVYKDGKIFACNEKGAKKHNEILLPKLSEVLQQAEISLEQIDEFGVVIGPGSFTGIRVGIATVKAFKDVFNKPVRAINNLNLLYEISKAQGNDCSAVAIEGSLNSYFVGKVHNNKIDIYERNLSLDELTNVVGGGEVAMYANTHNLDVGKCVEFDNESFVKAFLQSTSNDLTPVYYQLSQAENDKIEHADVDIREAEVWDIKAISELDKNNFAGAWNEQMLEKLLLSKSSVIYVVEIENKLVGFLVAENDVDEYNISHV